jgi:N-acetylglucosaminyldiphosphoundecaprenol N-acetyl-beta-D-mannosaminyltransferase
MIADRPPTVEILDCQVSKVDLPAALQALERMLHDGARHQVVCLTSNTILAARKHRRLRLIYNSASLALPDGLPVVWASRLLGEAIPGRVAGPDFMLAGCAAAARQGYTCFLLGGLGDTAERLAEWLRRANPGLRIVGAVSPPFHESFPAEANDRIIARVNRDKPDILWVGLGSPKQDLWIAENLERLSVRVAVGVGAAFDMYGGTVGRAPLWMQRSGMEWFYRFLREPRRLFRRYFLEASPFFPLVLGQRLRRRPPPCCF